MNLIVVSGNLIKDGRVVRDKGMDIYKNTIAVYRDFNASGESDFIDIVGFGHVGKYLRDYGRKGSYAILQGQLYTSKFVDSNGTKRRGFQIVVSKAKIINKVGNGSTEAEEDDELL